jgi:Flp pilus assembly protein TadG
MWMLLKRFWRDTAGGVAVLGALAMPVFVGGLGLGTEVGYWYSVEQRLQDAADVSAYAAAVELRGGAAAERMRAAANEAAVRTGFSPAAGTLSVASPPAAGAFAADPAAVEVVVREELPRLFTGLFASGRVPVAGRAVARVSQGLQACVLSLDPAAAGALAFTGSSGTTLAGCGLHANSLSDQALTVSGAGAVQAPCASTAGGVRATDKLRLFGCAAPVERAEVVPDPYADLPPPSLAQPCARLNTFGGRAPAEIGPGRYCGGLTIRTSVRMAPGVYVIDGGAFAANAQASVRGSEVTLYLTNGATLALNGSAELATMPASSSSSIAGRPM